jgi:hypothetical protein
MRCPELNEQHLSLSRCSSLLHFVKSGETNVVPLHKCRQITATPQKKKKKKYPLLFFCVCVDEILL